MIVHPNTKRAMEQRGYTVQASQHAPQGYDACYSIQVFRGSACTLDRTLDATTEQEARAEVTAILQRVRSAYDGFSQEAL